MTWKTEFGADYEPPREILWNPALKDTSWHNDTCPSFVPYADDSVQLFVQPRDSALRETYAETRFIVLHTHTDDMIDCLYEGNDVHEAIHATLDATIGK